MTDSSKEVNAPAATDAHVQEVSRETHKATSDTSGVDKAAEPAASTSDTHESDQHHHHHGLGELLHKIAHPLEHAHHDHDHEKSDPAAPNPLPTEGSAVGFKNSDVVGAGGLVGAGGGGGIGKI